MSEEIQQKGPSENNNNSQRGWPAYEPNQPGGPQPWPARLVWNVALWSLICAVAVSVVWGIPHVENRLHKQSIQKLTDAGIDPSTLNLRWSYRDLEVHGEVPAEVTSKHLAGILGQADGDKRSFFAIGVRNITVDVTAVASPLPAVVIPEEPSLLSVKVAMQRNSASLDGAVESVAQRKLLVDALLATGVESIHDNLDVSDTDDSPVGVDAKVTVLANMLSTTNHEKVARFHASLDRQRLEYHVSTLDRETAASIESAADVAIINFDISGEATTAQNAVVNVRVTSSEDQLRLDGQVFSDEQHRRLSFAASEASNGVRQVIDNVSVSPFSAMNPGSDVRVDGLAEIVALFHEGVSGEIKMQGSELLLEAAVGNEQYKSKIQEVAAAARGKGLVITERITIGEAAVLEENPVVLLQQKLNALSGKVAENVIFNSGNAELTSDAKFTLDLVGNVLLEHPGLRVEIEGHTDNVGRAAVNEELSRERASAVRQYLIERSVDAGRLVAVGYGSREPLVSNDTSEGRKTNRRVHFLVPDPQYVEQ